MNYFEKLLLCLLLMLGSGAAASQEIVEYIHTDALGSPVAVSNASGAVIERTIYEPYGASVGGGPDDAPGFTGHVADSATGLSYMQQRYMDPQLGVFLSVDPVTAYQQPVGQFNQYRYANSNPYKFLDPDGRLSLACGGSLCDRYRDQGGRTCEETCLDGKRTATSGVFVRHKTLKSQEKLIESVGGDVELLRSAHASHHEFVTTLIGFVAGGGFWGGGSATTKLYRAVGAAEAASIRETGRFSVGPNSLYGKWMAESAAHAREWGDKMYGPGTTTLMEVRLPKSVADQLMRLERLDGIGPARYGELNQLEQAVIREVP